MVRSGFNFTIGWFLCLESLPESKWDVGIEFSTLAILDRGEAWGDCSLKVNDLPLFDVWWGTKSVIFSCPRDSAKFYISKKDFRISALYL